MSYVHIRQSRVLRGHMHWNIIYVILTNSGWILCGKNVHITSLYSLLQVYKIILDKMILMKHVN